MYLALVNSCGIRGIIVLWDVMRYSPVMHYCLLTYFHAYLFFNGIHKYREQVLYTEVCVSLMMRHVSHFYRFVIN